MAESSQSAIPGEQRPPTEFPISSTNGEVGAASSPNSDEQPTVFHPADNTQAKHQLMNKWTLWHAKPPGKGKGTNWSDLLGEVDTFDSLEEFWGIYKKIAKPSELALKSDYHLFKAGVRPEWEDPQNSHGGKWAYQFRDKRAVPIDDLWLYLMLAAIAETLEPGKRKEIIGVAVNVRKAFYRIAVWTKTTGKGGSTKEELIEIGKRFKEVLKLGEKESVGFSGHTESAHAGTSRVRAKFAV